ncbi:MAG: PD40 domain-containing protein [Candidatus Marinimicrobia bacterium]|nr:PD40 domain-containing protein [Candidatus Neomarinimicrobiota bacterium]
MNLVFKSQIPLLFIFSLMLINCEPQPTAPIEKPDNRIFIDTDPAWSPDGKWIAYTHCRRDTIGWDGIYIIDTAGTTLEPYIKGGRYPDWSPDGSYIAFGYSRNIYTTTMDSSKKIIQLTTNGNSFLPSWSPDGEWIAFNISVNSVEDTSGTNIVRIDGTKKRYLCGGGAPDWSPDGTKIVTGWYEIVIHSISGDYDKQLTNSSNNQKYNNRHPAWSLNGRYIVWEHNFEVWIMNTDGSNQKKLTDGENPHWSPDSEKIVFSRYVDDHNALFIIDRDGTNIRKITGHETYS